MDSRFQTSTGKLMLLVVVAAGELALFRQVWQVREMLLLPPITMLFLAINLGLFYLLVRPRALKTRILGMIWSGVAASFVIGGYLAISDYVQGIRGRDPALLGRMMQSGLEYCVTTLEDRNPWEAATLQRLLAYVSAIEFALLDVVGWVMIWYGGHLESWLRGRWRASRAGGCDS